VQLLDLVSDVTGLPIRDALLSWGDPFLVQRIKLLEWLVVGVNRHPLKWGSLRLPSDDRPPPTAYGVDLYKCDERLAEAWLALLSGFRKRIEAAEFRLAGVKTGLIESHAREAISHLRAADFHFDVDRNIIVISDGQFQIARYVAVLISKVSVDAKADEGSRTALTESTRPKPTGAEPRRKRPGAAAKGNGGRKPYAPIIEAALRRYLKESGTTARGPRTPKPIWVRLAKTLRSRLIRAGKVEAPVVPSEDKIRKHLPLLYQRVLGETLAELNSAQKSASP
jgi:hypothetical protein